MILKMGTRNDYIYVSEREHERIKRNNKGSLIQIGEIVSCSVKEYASIFYVVILWVSASADSYNVIAGRLVGSKVVGV